jgi:DNA-binding NtrC family response regulator
MPTAPETADGTRDSSHRREGTQAGLIVVFTGATAASTPVRLDARGVAVGREGALRALWNDARLSRNHCTIRLSPRGWVVQDLGSRNGTFVDGVPVTGEVVVPSPKVIRAADTLLLPVTDLAGYEPVAVDEGTVVGSKLRQALAIVDRAAASSDALLLIGESGTGKEIAAHRFHARGPNARGPFVAVNCATIPQGLAERLLFGARRGAYSGAETDSIGHAQAAHGGVLFLDEAGDLDPLVQAKLLRMLEAREVMPLGATQPTRLAMRVCFAAQGDLRTAVANGRFRADLYHRIAPPEAHLPPLRERLDEIAAHVAAATAGADGAPPAQAKLVEACLLRSWPGNVRELRRHVREAALRAIAEGADRVRLAHLAPSAGQPTRPVPSLAARRVKRSYVKRAGQLTREAVERALADNRGSVTDAARSLGMQRNQLYREMARHGVARGPKDE